MGLEEEEVDSMADIFERSFEREEGAGKKIESLS